MPTKKKPREAAVHKYALPVGSDPLLPVVIYAPEGAEPISLQCVNRTVWLWMLCDPEEEPVQHTFYALPTSTTIAAEKLGEFVGTFLWEHNDIVGHVFKANI